MRYVEIIREPLLEMSMARPLALLELRGTAKPLNLHLILMYGYQADEGTRTHWRHEILNWLDDVATITLKPKDRRLSEKDYYTYLFDERFGPRAIANVTATHRRIKRDKPDLGSPILSDDEIWSKMAEFHHEFTKRASQGQSYDDIVP